MRAITWGAILTDGRNQISDLDKVREKDLGKGRRTPEGLREWLLGNNAVIVEAKQFLSDYELVTSFMSGNITNAYQFRDEVTMHALTA